jgi:hypothetical protein
MAEFSIGQAVRVVGDELSGLAGACGHITEIHDGPGFQGHGGTLYGLDICPILDIGDGWLVGFASYELEPIVPLGGNAVNAALAKLLRWFREEESVTA